MKILNHFIADAGATADDDGAGDAGDVGDEDAAQDAVTQP